MTTTNNSANSASNNNSPVGKLSSSADFTSSHFTGPHFTGSNSNATGLRAIAESTAKSGSTRSTIARTATDWSAAAVGKVRDNVAGWTRTRRQGPAYSLGICLSVDPDRTSCIVGIIGVVDATNVRDLTRVLHTVRSYRFVSIDLTGATFNHPIAQVRFDHVCEQLEVAGITVAVSGARDDMGSHHS